MPSETIEREAIHNASTLFLGRTELETAEVRAPS
jgi:hypothetical protein